MTDRTSTTRRRALATLAATGFAAFAPATAVAKNGDDDAGDGDNDDGEDDDSPGNSGGNRKDDGHGDHGRGNDDDRDDDRDDDDRDDDHGNSSSPSVSVSRSDDGSAFTGGQTNRVDLAVSASESVLVRDRVPEEWSVVAGDAHEVYREGGVRYVEFEATVADGTVTYLAEAPSAPTTTGTYEFGPVEYSVDESEWTAVGATDRNAVVSANT